MLWQVCVSNQCVCNSSTLCSNEGNSDVFSGACCQGDRFLISFSAFFFKFFLLLFLIATGTD